MDEMTLQVERRVPQNAKLAVQRIWNYSDTQIADLQTEVFELMKNTAPDFTGGSFEFIGDVGRYATAFVVTESMIIGVKRMARSWFVGRKSKIPGERYAWVVTKI